MNKHVKVVPELFPIVSAVLSALEKTKGACELEVCVQTPPEEDIGTANIHSLLDIEGITLGFEMDSETTTLNLYTCCENREDPRAALLDILDRINSGVARVRAALVGEPDKIEERG